jgi:glycosyltransferase involved in cell wall biosynthesis
LSNISVCIPTYNQAAFLKQSVYSALNQTKPPFEIIVSNDCSTDTTRALLEQLLIEIPNLIVIHQTVNLGMCGNSDFCLREATGDFIVKLDSDDFLEYDYCEKLSILLEKYPEAGYAHSNIHQIDQDGKFQRDRILTRNDIYMTSDKALLASVKGYRVAANIIMFRRTALESVYYLTGRPIHFAEDYHLSVDLAINGWGNVFSNEILANYRVWSDAGNVRAKRKLVEIQGLEKIFSELFFPSFKKRGWNQNILTKQLKNIACIHANCLSRMDYNQVEKNEIQSALLILSDSPKVKFYIVLYKYELGSVLNALKKIENIFKVFIKKLIWRLNESCF